MTLGAPALGVLPLPRRATVRAHGAEPADRACHVVLVSSLIGGGWSVSRVVPVGVPGGGRRGAGAVVVPWGWSRRWGGELLKAWAAGGRFAGAGSGAGARRWIARGGREGSYAGVESPAPARGRV